MAEFGRGRLGSAIALVAAVGLPGAAGSELAADSGLAAEVRIFEVRRLSSDFSPIEGLSFRLASDGARVRTSDWLATLARRIPDAYFAQLLTLGPMRERSETIRRRNRRAVRLRLSPLGTEDPGTGAGHRRFSVELALLRGTATVHTIRREGAVEAGTTLVMSGRDFEIPLSDYLSWFREPGGLEARGQLYERLRGHSIFLALGVSFRADEDRAETDRAGAAPRHPIRLRAPADPHLLDLDNALVGRAKGTVRLRLRLDGEGAPEHTEVLETTLPEVTPRVLGIVSGWRFPQAAGREGRLRLTVASRGSPDRGR